MDTLLQDVRFAIRTLLKNPGFASLTILCLALGIGVNSTIYSMVDTIVVRPLPFRAAGELVRLTPAKPKEGVDRANVSPVELQDWKDRTHVFAVMAGVQSRRLTFSDRDEPERLVGSLVTWNLFPMLGVEPILGRQFRQDEDQFTSPPVVLLSHGLWERRYSADPAIVGRAITIEGKPHVVVGVMPPKFRFPEISELWIPRGRSWPRRRATIVILWCSRGSSAALRSRPRGRTSKRLRIDWPPNSLRTKDGVRTRCRCARISSSPTSASSC